MLIDARSSCLLVVDIQERLAPGMADTAGVVGNARILLTAARRLDVPVMTSEQYPKGLGHTVPELKPLVDAARTVEKMHFSCLGDRDYGEAFRSLGRSQAVVAGIEAHVCVLQTVSDLLADGVKVFVVGDAISSRTEANRHAAIERMRGMGADVVTTEMVVFEWLVRAGTPEFKELSALIR